MAQLVAHNLRTYSRNIARDFEKEHSKVVRSIKQIINSKPEWGIANFGETPYVDPQNSQTYQMSEMTRHGFSYVQSVAGGGNPYRFLKADLAHPQCSGHPFSSGPRVQLRTSGGV